MGVRDVAKLVECLPSTPNACVKFSAEKKNDLEVHNYISSPHEVKTKESEDHR